MNKVSGGNPLKQLAGQTTVYGLGVVLPRLLNYLFLTPFYTRVFEPEVYGVVTELYAYVVFLLVILTYGMETGFFRFASSSTRSGKVYSSVLASVFVTSLAFLALVFGFDSPISRVLSYEEHPEYIRWLASIVAIDAFTSIPFARIRLQNRALRYTLIRLVEIGVNLGANFFFLFYCPRHLDSELVLLLYRPEIGVGYVLISNLLSGLVKLVLLLPQVLAAFRARFDWTLLKQVLKYAYPLLIAGMAGVVNEALDRVLLKHLVDATLNPMEQLGIYGANYKLAVLMTLFVQMFKYAAEPFFFSRAADRGAKVLYADVMTVFVVAGLLIFLFVNLFLDYFILFIGEDFREGASIVPVVLLANLMMGVFFNLSIWYKLKDKNRLGAILVITGALVTIGINLLFVPRYSYHASAWAHLFAYSIMVLLSYLWSRRYYAVPYRVGRIVVYFALALILFAIYKLFLPGLRFPSEISGALIMMLFMATVAWNERALIRKYKAYQA